MGLAQDLDVSAGKTSPSSAGTQGVARRRQGRPGPSRRVRRNRVFRLDRLVRSVSHLWRMIEWSENHDVLLVSATEKHFDLSDRSAR
ncbi:recombinase family protein [Rhodococcus hoagii]|nr:recombinase family protein [Prescottella equi]